MNVITQTFLTISYEYINILWKWHIMCPGKFINMYALAKCVTSAFDITLGLHWHLRGGHRQVHNYVVWIVRLDTLVIYLYKCWAQKCSYIVHWEASVVRECGHWQISIGTVFSHLKVIIELDFCIFLKSLQNGAFVIGKYI